MQLNWAEENLQVIRTLMERSSVYRRALAPIMLSTGCLGILAAILGWNLKLAAVPGFLVYWAVVSVVAICLAFLLARRQAAKDAEPFWSGPTRRVGQALLPGLAVGLVLGVLALYVHEPLVCSLLALAWVMLYGCAIHSAGFFTPPGMKRLGWIFIIGGAGLCFFMLAQEIHAREVPAWFANFVMGLFFGALHLAYGIYLRASEKKHRET